LQTSRHKFYNFNKQFLCLSYYPLGTKNHAYPSWKSTDKLIREKYHKTDRQSSLADDLQTTQHANWTFCALVHLRTAIFLDITFTETI